MNLAVVGRARTHGVPVPRLETVYRLVRLVQDEYLAHLKKEGSR